MTTTSARTLLVVEACVLFYGFFLVGEAVLSGSPSARVVWLPVVGASAYASTLVIFVALGVWAMARGGLPGLVPLVFSAALIEAAWNPLFVLGHPWFVATAQASQPLWGWYVAGVYLVLAWLSWSSYMRKRFRLTRWSFLFPSYAAFYFVLGMPTVTFHSTVPFTFLLENLFTVTCIGSVLGSVRPRAGRDVLAVT